jgi:broad specificity phosphatase PhoE
VSAILLIRHGQASFGADDYDVLSELGERQSRWLGEHLATLGVRPGRVIAGTLARQRATAERVLDGLGLAAGGLPIETHPGLDEYDAGSLFEGWLARNPDARPEPGDRRAHFRFLSDAISAWQRDEIDGAEPWGAFEARTADALAMASEGIARDEATLVSTSGGVIGQALRKVLGAPVPAMVQIHMQVKNASYSRLFPRRGGHWLSSFNETPHLDGREGAVTWS